MSVQSEIDRINGAKSTLAANIESAGFTAVEGANIVQLASTVGDAFTDTSSRLATVNGASGTINTQLDTLDGTKTAIKDAIVAKGVEVPDGTTFYEYAGKIASIESGGGFTGTATVTLSGTSFDIEYGYIDEGMNLLLNSSASSSDFPLTVPVPQIIYISAYGRNEGMSISGDYEIVRNITYPTAKAIYIKGDITVTPS